MNEFKNNIISKLPDKPKILVLYDMVEATKLPLVSGGFVDQPYIWTLLCQVITEVKKMMDAMDKSSSGV